MRMTKSATGARRIEGPRGGLNDSRCRRIQLRLERRGCRRGDEPCADAFDGRDQLTEAFGLQGGDDLRAGAGELDRVVHNHRPAGAPYRFDDGVDIQRHQGPQIDDLSVDALLLQLFCGLEAFEHAAPVADDGHVRSGTLDVSLTERYGESGIRWHRALLP